jgi:hypothetical protein
MRFRHILAPTDFPEYSKQAWRRAPGGEEVRRQALYSALSSCHHIQLRLCTAKFDRDLLGGYGAPGFSGSGAGGP